MVQGRGRPDVGKWASAPIEVASEKPRLALQSKPWHKMVGLDLDDGPCGV